jgi:hypothetical protein
VKYVLTSVLLLTVGAAASSVAVSAQKPQTYTGIITDNVCATEGHTAMRMGPTDAECTLACVDVHGSAYVLYDGKNVYQLSDQKTPQQFAARKVKVTGTLDAKTKTIQVDSMIAVK